MVAKTAGEVYRVSGCERVLVFRRLQ